MSPKNEPFWIQVKQFSIVPVCHHSMEYAREVSRAFLAVEPQRVAVELAPFLLDGLQKAVARLPRLSTLVYQIGAGEGAQTRLFPVEPTDAFVEAARSAQDQQLPLHAIDLPMDYRQQQQDWVPDSASITAIGFKAFYQMWLEKMGDRPTPADLEREVHMAHSLINLARFHPDDKILVVVGMAHAGRLAEFLDTGDAPLKVPTPFDPGAVTLYEPDQDTVRASSWEIPWVMSVYEMGRGGAGGDEYWQPPPPPPAEPEDPRDRLKDVDPTQVVASLESMLGLRRRRMPPMDKQQRKALSRYLEGLREEPAALFHLLNQFGPNKVPEKLELPQVRARSARAQAFTFKQAEDRRQDLRGLYQAAWEESGGELDRQAMLEALMRSCAHFYTENTGDQIANWQFRTLYQYVRNYAQLQGRLLPSVYELTMGARGVADDNYAYEVWDLGTFYPWSPAEGATGEVPPLRIDDDQLLLDGRRVVSWRPERKIPRLVRKRAKEDEAGDWAEEFEGGSICSYPAEDLIIEDYARYLQKKAIQQMSSEKTRVEPFTTSLMDGIDMRETLRNWHDRKLFVRDIRRVTGGVGAVILIFDEDKHDDRYPWRMTWHGEHSQESDMAFYATPANMKLVGPGISRCEYGGLLMTYPNRRLENIWADPTYTQLRSKSEVLLMGALEYGLDRHVVYVSASPPRSQFRSTAARLGKRIVYMPIGSLSPQSIQKIRIFHVLSDHQKRKIAKDYIW